MISFLVLGTGVTCSLFGGALLGGFWALDRCQALGYTLLIVPRHESLTGVPWQLRKVAGKMPDAHKIAASLGKYSDLLALPCFHDLQDEADDLTQARALMTAITSELERMKQPRDSESAIEANARVRLAEVIDGIYALTSEWRAYEYITPRRRVLLGHPPGAGDTRSMRDGMERAIHVELADRLSRRSSFSPPSWLLRFEEAHDFVTDLYREVGTPELTAVAGDSGDDRHKELLIYFVQHIEALTFAHQLIILLIAKAEREGSLMDTYASVGLEAEIDALATEIEDISSPLLAVSPSPTLTYVFAQRWPWFNRREWSMLTTAFSQSGDVLDPFLHYLESRKDGRALLERWCRWVKDADWNHIASYYDSASTLLKRWSKGQALLHGLEGEDEFSFEQRLLEDLDYLCGIGAILIRPQEGNPPAVSYRLYSQRRQEQIPKGWEVLLPQAVGLVHERYLTELFERHTM